MYIYVYIYISTHTYIHTHDKCINTHTSNSRALTLCIYICIFTLFFYVIVHAFNIDRHQISIGGNRLWNHLLLHGLRSIQRNESQRG